MTTSAQFMKISKKNKDDTTSISISSKAPKIHGGTNRQNRIKRRCSVVKHLIFNSLKSRNLLCMTDRLTDKKINIENLHQNFQPSILNSS